MTLTFTQDQQAALDAIDRFMRDPTATAFLLEGGAGTGKTTLLGEALKRYDDGTRCCATPTHKATNVLRRKLSAAGVEWCQGYDEYSYNGSDVVTGTTASLLGIAPVVDDEQSTEVKFGKTSGGLLGKFFPELLVVDEVSMLSWPDFKALVKKFKERGSKIIAVGDAGQLPPVKQMPIPFDRFTHKHCLREIVRQAAGSAIVDVAWAIRDGKPWRDIIGTGLERVDRLGAAFVERITAPGERPEEERSCFVAYRNCRVDEVQRAACLKVYGHDAETFAAGEQVIAEASFYTSKVLCCANQDPLLVRSIHYDERDEQRGVPVTLQHCGFSNKTFRAFYLSGKEMRDPKHPFNVELERLRTTAVNLQEEYKSLKAKHDYGRASLVDSKRRQAWVSFFYWKDSVCLSFRHPFALTSHKSQGSTFREVFADMSDLARFSQHACYVAVTRPSTNLVVAS